MDEKARQIYFVVMFNVGCCYKFCFSRPSQYILATLASYCFSLSTMALTKNYFSMLHLKSSFAYLAAPAMSWHLTYWHVVDFYPFFSSFMTTFVDFGSRAHVSVVLTSWRKGHWQENVTSCLTCISPLMRGVEGNINTFIKRSRFTLIIPLSTLIWNLHHAFFVIQWQSMRARPWSFKISDWHW